MKAIGSTGLSDFLKNDCVCVGVRTERKTDILVGSLVLGLIKKQ